MTYFRRYRMELNLRGFRAEWNHESLAGSGYQLVGYDNGLIREHAQAKYHSFCREIDADVFPCLGRRDGCLRLMREITSRAAFVPGATWLLRYHDRPGGRGMPVGTVQGIEQEGWGAIQNLGVITEHRGRGLGRLLLVRAAAGFQAAGLDKMHLEVTTANTGAIRLYEQVGFRRAKVVYKACEIVG
ncbi:GNAT family N-acetyltransferase [Rhodopirellula sp. ICT_H3.1]|uniref:GNAT family N-acetyltransferase n=2 Tax=Aporhodopirellula aestuarii TaxID=2950107 RepID=A0ABT0U5Q7_9BACT|nr:GNAT family N-acetyltransferase [Aporhodopirellula aestuarii]